MSLARFARFYSAGFADCSAPISARPARRSRYCSTKASSCATQFSNRPDKRHEQCCRKQTRIVRHSLSLAICPECGAFTSLGYKNSPDELIWRVTVRTVPLYFPNWEAFIHRSRANVVRRPNTRPFTSAALRAVPRLETTPAFWSVYAGWHHYGENATTGGHAGSL